jgi:DNA-binding response OmpR family regulator
MPATQLAALLVADGSPDAARYVEILRGNYRVATTASTEAAKQLLHRDPPALVIADLTSSGLDGFEICRQAKTLTQMPPVLVTTTVVERVPDALAAGCDGVLLKPFAPNLVVARLGRLTRARSEMLRTRATQSHLKSTHLADRLGSLRAGTNRVWPNTHCPYCNHHGVTSFEFCSHRRSWYACLECKKVWIAKRQE